MPLLRSQGGVIPGPPRTTILASREELMVCGSWAHIDEVGGNKIGEGQVGK